MEKKAPKKNTSKKTNLSHKILIEPWITESSTMQGELNKYVFRVLPSANKKEIEKAVRELYGVEAVQVNTIKIPKKFRTYGRTSGWKSGFKKAIVTLKEGDKIDFFEK